jgi:hypothetical protein
MRTVCAALVAAMIGLPAAAACPPGQRFAGVLTEPRGQDVTVARAGRNLRLVAGSERLCTNDLVVAGAVPVVVDLTAVVRTEITIPPGKERPIPSALDLLADLLRAWAPFLAQEEARAVKAVTLGGERVFEFGVSGLLDGRSVVTAKGGPLYVPVRSDYAVAVVLIDPRGRRSKPRNAPSGETLVAFDAPSDVGFWKVHMLRPDGELVGRFQVIREAPAEPPLPAVPDAFAAATLWACQDLGRNGLESLRRVPPADRERLARISAYWSDPHAATFCGSP